MSEQEINQIAVRAYCDAMDDGTDSMVTEGDLEKYDIRAVKIVANAVASHVRAESADEISRLRQAVAGIAEERLSKVGSKDAVPGYRAYMAFHSAFPVLAEYEWDHAASGTHAQWEAVEKAISTDWAHVENELYIAQIKEAESAARIAALEAALKAHEAWEADVIMNGDFSDGTLRLTQAQHDALNEVQSKRNAALYGERAALQNGDGK